MFLSDMGADVIHVETPAGDAMRHYRTLWGAEFLLDHDRNTFTEDILRNKQSLTVDLRHEEGREIVRRLADDADVFITNYRPQAAVKNGLDHETLLARNPRLVYAHGTSYGLVGPDKDAPGLEMMGLAKGGIMLGSAVEGGEPVYPTMGLNDRLGAIGLLVAILSALVARERTGEGQLVETSLLGWAVNLQSVAISYTANTGKDLRPLPRLEQDDPNYNVYQLKDGSWTALGMTIHPDKYWPILCDALGLPDLVDDPRFVTQDARRENYRELIDIYDGVFGTLTWDEWEERIRTYELIACRVNALTDLHEDEQVLANELPRQSPHPDLGTWWYVPTPIHYSKTPVSIRSAAPAVGARYRRDPGRAGLLGRRYRRPPHAKRGVATIVVDTAERALPVGRYSVPTLDWVRMPAAGGKVEPPVYGLDEILDGVAEAGFQAVGLDDLTVGDLDPADVASALRRRGLLCSEVGILRAGQPRETSAAAHDLTWLAQATGASCCITMVADPPPADALAALETAAAVARRRGRSHGARVRRLRIGRNALRGDRALRVSGLGAVRASARQLARAPGRRPVAGARVARRQPDRARPPQRRAATLRSRSGARQPLPPGGARGRERSTSSASWTCSRGSGTAVRSASKFCLPASQRLLPPRRRETS